jgi:REP element-mobilizing transposase RayT
MARALRLAYAGAFYHVTCRGNARQPIFRDDHDRQAFVSRLGISLETYQVTLHVYVLMPNHFHLVVETPRASLSEFMRHFNVTYTGYFNRRNGWVRTRLSGINLPIDGLRDGYLRAVSLGQLWPAGAKTRPPSPMCG